MPLNEAVKPKPLRENDIYADFDERPQEGQFMYIGGRCYQDSAQIHLSKAEFLQLSDWMQKAAKWVRARGKP